MRVAVKFAYDGREFHGFARQPGLRTVEDELIKTLIHHGFIEDTEVSRFRSASRTDKGVSALSNVIAFNTESSKDQIFKKLTADVSDILIYGIAEVDSDFYPRYAKQRIYRYYLKKSDLDVEKVIHVAALFTGEHNFTNFARIESFKDPLRTIDNIIIENQEECFVIDFYAQTFLWNQIRRIVSAIYHVGCGDLQKEQLVEALHNPDTPVDFGLAPPEPLLLKDILYNFEFDYDEKALSELQELEQNIVSSFTCSSQ